jgi:thymidine kinase
MDYERKPFVTMAFLLSIANKIDKLTSICLICKGPGNLSLRKTKDAKLMLIGANDAYLPVCCNCYLGKNGKEKINPN